MLSPPSNPAVTLARAFTDTFAGIRPADTPVKIAVFLPQNGEALMETRL
jgi:hypothetical protein